MPNNRKEINTKLEMHVNNKHRQRYVFKELLESYPDLKEYVIINKYGDESIDFANPKSVLALNKALLFKYYNIRYYDIPEGYLCPPVPGRADYIHHVAELLGEANYGVVPMGAKVKCVDIGTGSNCIYPIIGAHEYGWSFVATDIDEVAIESAKKIVENNPGLRSKVEIKLQPNHRDIFKGVIDKREYYDVCICNPPFNASREESIENSLRKERNLKGKEIEAPTRNFGGQSNELWCFGGEKVFVKDMIFESRRFSKTFKWFTTLISKKSNLEYFEGILKTVNAKEVKIIPMAQGNKISRIIAWRF